MLHRPDQEIGMIAVSDDDAATACRICDTPAAMAFTTTVLGRHRARFYSCDTCGCLQSERPYWLEEAYAEAIGASDTGLLARNARFSQAAAVVFYALFDRTGRFVDYGGGHGVFVRLMRDFGFDFLWQDRYATNLFARGFEYLGQTPIEAVTAFEVLEHLVDPGAQLAELFAMSGNLMCSTVLMNDEGIPPADWWYYAFDHGTHICFYRRRTLDWLAQRHGLHCVSNGRDLHLFTRNPVRASTFKFLVGASSRLGAARWIRRRMPSLTEKDRDAVMVDERRRNAASVSGAPRS